MSVGRTRNENRREYPWNWRRISYRVKRLHGFRCERCGHPHVPAYPATRNVRDLWEHDWEVEEGVFAPVVFRRGDTGLGRSMTTFETPCDRRCSHIGDGKQRTLTVHHLDGDKANYRLWNLAALCQVCHLQIQAKVCWDQTYLGQHSEWMRWHIERYRRWCERTGRTAIH